MAEARAHLKHGQEEDQVEAGIQRFLRMILVAGQMEEDIPDHIAVASYRTMKAVVQEVVDMKAAAPLGLIVGF